MTELEIKFGIPGPMRASLQRTLQEHGGRVVELEAHYFDTPEGLLASRRVALRLRYESGHWVQALKAPGQGAVHRLEHEVRLPGTGRARPRPDLQRHAVGPAAEVVAGLIQGTESGLPLTARHGTRVSRLQCLLKVGETMIEAALDRGHAHAGACRVALQELELEYRAGPVRGLFELADAWIAHGGLWLSTINKAQRGERLLRDALGASDTDASTPPARATRAGMLTLRNDADGGTVLRALLQSALEHVLANASEVAEDRAAPDVIHQLRVALRRLRTLLRELADWSSEIRPEWGETLTQSFRMLGQCRDRQVLSTTVQPLLEAAQAPQIDLRSASDAPDPGQVVREREFQRVLLQILALAHADDASFVPMPAHEVRAQLVKRLNALHGKIRKQARRFERLPLADQHRMRKRLKRLRYLADFTQALWPSDALRRYLKTLNRAQKALGVHNDVATAAQSFRAEARAHPQAWFAAGWLQSHLALTAHDARKALQKVAAAPVFWGR